MKPNLMERIMILSDGTGETAETCVRAILAQFKQEGSKLRRVPEIKTENDLEEAIKDLKAPYMVVYTFAATSLRKAAWRMIRERKLIGLDLLYPALDVFSEFLKQDPSQASGVLHSTQAVGYFDRVEAIEFTVKHDDGLRMDDLHRADIILVGVSRSSKTPTSIYLAHRGFKVANVPLVPGIELPQDLIDVSSAGIPIVCLVIQPYELHNIRKARVSNLGQSKDRKNSYVDMDQIQSELKATSEMARKYGWALIDITDRAIEETASEILLLVESKKS